MQTVALKPKRREWLLLAAGLAAVCLAMIAAPALCAPLALLTPLLGCPLAGRREAPVAWITAVFPMLLLLLENWHPTYAASVMLIGLLPMLLTQFMPLKMRSGPRGMILYMTAVACALIMVLGSAAAVLGTPLHMTLAQLMVREISQMEDVTQILQQLAAFGLLSVPDGYTAQNAALPLLQNVYNQQMLMSLRLTLEMLLAQVLPSVLVQASILVGLFTVLRLERMKGILLVVEARKASEKHTHVVAPPGFRQLTLSSGLRTLALAMWGTSAVLLFSASPLWQMVAQLCNAVFQTLYSLLGAAIVVYVFTRSDPDRRIPAGLIAAVLYAAVPYMLMIIGILDRTFHFRNSQAHKPN